MPKFDYEEIHEPVEMYKNRFKREFAEKASAFSEVKRRTYVSVFGRDLCFHDVPVDYYEYLPVVKDTEIKVCQTNALDSMICGAMDAATLTYRRGLAAFKAEN